jgi:hypothetical protein
MIEAMACGTPIIAFRRGSVPEVVEDGTSGFVVDTIEEAVSAVRRIVSLDRTRVCAAFERRFTVERMARDYVQIYQELTPTRATSDRLRTLNGRVKALNAVQSVAAGLVPATAHCGADKDTPGALRDVPGEGMCTRLRGKRLTGIPYEEVTGPRRPAQRGAARRFGRS